MDQNCTQEKQESQPQNQATKVTKKPVSLKLLCSQIENAIQTIESKEEGQRIIARINQNNVLDEQGYASKLFESYVAIVNQSKASKSEQKDDKVEESSSPSSSSSEMTDMDDIEILREVPDYLYRGTGKKIAGWDALRRNIFWIRIAMVFFCLFSFSVMESLPHINSSSVVNSNMLLEYNCRENSQYGEFSYRSYKFVANMGIITFLYSVFFCLYYLIPVDAQDRKFIPASPLYVYPLRWNKIYLCECNTSFRYVEVIMDGLLFLLCLIAGIAAAANFDRSVAFHSEAIWVSECAYGQCDAIVGGCLNEYSYCEQCDNIRCSDGSCSNPEGFCENICDDALRCLDGSCPNENNVCDYGPDNLITYSTRPGPELMYYSLHTFVKTYAVVDGKDCIDHNPVGIIRAALTFLFFVVILLVVALQITLRSLYMEKVRRDVASGKKSLPLADDSAHDKA